MKLKNITAMTIAALMIATIAEASVNDPKYERTTGKVTVSGIGLNKGETARMIVLKPDANYDDLKSGIKTFDESCIHIAEIVQTDDSETYQFPVFTIKDGTAAGMYRIMVTEGTSLEPVEKTIDYASISQTLDFIKDATAAEQVKDYIDRFNTDVYELPIGEGTVFYKLSDKGRLKVLDKLRGVDYKAIADLRDKFAAELATYEPLYEIEAFDAIKNAKSSSDISSAIDEHNRFYGIDTENEKFKLDSDGKVAVFDKLVGETYTTPEALQKAFKQKTVLYYIQKGPWGKIAEYITEYNDSVLGLDLSNYRAENTGLLKSLVGQNCKNVSDLQKLIDNYDSGTGGGGSSSRGNTSSRDSDNKIDSRGLSSISVLPTTTGSTFSDVPTTHWAYESIEALYKKSIIKGKGEGVFAPEDSVTRSEAIKMIVLAMNLNNTVGNTVSFADLSADDWEYDYVLRGVQAGVIKGKDKNIFGGNDNITRQDMCVMIYRAMLSAGYEFPNGSSEFSDSEQISDYAVEAINALANKNIVSGTGNGYFEPLSTTTRAQVAKMIYSVIK